MREKRELKQRSGLIDITMRIEILEYEIKKLDKLREIQDDLYESLMIKLTDQSKKKDDLERYISYLQDRRIQNETKHANECIVNSNLQYDECFVSEQIKHHSIPYAKALMIEVPQNEKIKVNKIQVLNSAQFNFENDDDEYVEHFGTEISAAVSVISETTDTVVKNEACLELYMKPETMCSLCTSVNVNKFLLKYGSEDHENKAVDIVYDQTYINMYQVEDNKSQLHYTLPCFVNSILSYTPFWNSGVHQCKVDNVPSTPVKKSQKG